MIAIKDRKFADSSAKPNHQDPVDTEFITAWKWSTDEEHVHWPRKKQPRRSGTTSRTNVQSSRPIGRAASGLQMLDSHAVKRSALLYEITERTKQLAKPRFKTLGENQDSQISHEIHNRDDERDNESRANSKFPKISPRVLELSRPKVVSGKPAKISYGSVAPGALRAVATQRTVELSEPKKQPVQALPVTTIRKSYLIPCSPRILSLARPKRPLTSAKGRTGSKNSRRRPRLFFSHFRRKSRKNSYKRLGYTQLVNVTDNSSATNNNSRKERTRPSSSNRSVIVIETLCKPKKFKCRSRR